MDNSKLHQVVSVAVTVPLMIPFETDQTDTYVNIHVYGISDKPAKVWWLSQESETAIDRSTQTDMGQSNQEMPHKYMT